MAEAVQNYVKSLNWGHRVQLQERYGAAPPLGLPWVTSDPGQLLLVGAQQQGGGSPCSEGGAYR